VKFIINYQKMSDYDTKTLYNNPDELTSAELLKIRNKIRFQRIMPYFGAFSATSLMMAFFGPRQRSLVLAGAAVGYLVGCNAASSARTCYVKEDDEIMMAWD
jgi:hypothetical protein